MSVKFWDPKKPEAPFDGDGNMLHYPDNFYMNRDGGWRQVQPFEATLTIVGLNRGRSAAYLTVVDEAGHNYPLFITDLVDIIQNRDIIGGRLTGRWAVRKRGQNFGIGPAKESQP